MGDRVLIQFRNDQEVSPVIYGHWFGEDAPALIAGLREQMADRPDDLSYIAARCVGRMCAGDPARSTGIGMWSTDKELTKEASQGDNGCFVVKVGPVWEVTHIAGYSKTYPAHQKIVWKQGERK